MSGCSYSPVAVVVAVVVVVVEADDTMFKLDSSFLNVLVFPLVVLCLILSLSLCRS